MSSQSLSRSNSSSSLDSNNQQLQNKSRKKGKIGNSTLPKSNQQETDATESSLSAVEKKVRADGQTESKPVSEKTESDSSTSVETEKSDD